MKMLSRDNQREMVKKHTNHRQHYALKKLTVGVSSVLVGLSFLGVQAQSVSADDAATPALATTQVKPVSNGSQSTANQAAAAPAGAQDALVAVSNSAAEREALNHNLPAISTDNPGNGSAIKQAGDHAIAGLPNEAQYNLSVTAQNGSTSGSQAGRTSGIYLPDSETTNHALINYRTAQNLQLNFELSNPTGQQMQVSPVVYLNPYGPYHNVVNPSLLRFGGRGEIVDQNGQPIDGLQIVFAINGDQTEYTYDELLAHGLSVGQADTFKVVGNLAGHTTVHVVLPLTFDAAKLGAYLVGNQPVSNEIWLAGGQNAGTISAKLSTPLWQQVDVANDDIVPMLKTGESLYQVLSARAAAQLRAAMPKAGAVLEGIVNADGKTSGNNPVFWMNGTYQLKLSQLQAVLRQFGYTVNLTPDGQHFMDYYSYSTKPLQGVENAGGGLDTNTHYGFFIEVHPILMTKDTETQVGSEQLDGWQPTDNIAAVNNLEYQGSDSTGANFKQVAADPNQVQVVSIKNQAGQTVSTIDPDVPGTYVVTYEYYLNGKQSSDFRFTNTAQIKVVQGTTPVEPVNPEIIDPNKVQPNNDQARDQDDNDQPVKNENGHDWTAAGRGQVNVQGQLTGQKFNATGTVTPTARGQQQLPQTGNHDSLAVAGLGMISLLAMFGLAGVKKH